MLSWEIITYIGLVSFSASGAIIAMEEGYDIFGVYILGLATAFGGGTLRNLLIGVPVSDLWSHIPYFTAVIVTMTTIYLLPNLWNRFKRSWTFFDAVGLAAFSIQGAAIAAQMEMPLPIIVVAGVLTGTGGGVLRDMMAGRKPIIFHKEVYAIWAVLTGLVVAIGWTDSLWGSYAVLIVVIILRMGSVRYHWSLPRNSKYGTTNVTDSDISE